MKNKIQGSTYFLIFSIVILIIFILITFFTLSNNMKIARNNNINNNTVYEENIKENPTAKTTIEEFVEIASYKTNIYDTDENRIYNIKLACKKLNGHIVKANTEFSFNNVLGSMGEADGFKKALGFDSNGNDIKVYGGGICQISSTLYNAVLIANLKVTERHAHSKRVHYVPKDKDATVFYGGPDLKFINNTGKNIQINAQTDGYTVTVSLKSQEIKSME